MHGTEGGALVYGPAPVFDWAFPAHERMPRRFSAVIERVVGARPPSTTLKINGSLVGDRLTDNARRDDGYRYHDVFHLALFTVLGWSPTLRAMLGRKRRSDPRVDETEDGGRAIAIEEGICALTFSSGRAGLPILTHVMAMTSHLEVSACSAAEWRQALALGLDTWYRVRKHGGGTLLGDLEFRELNWFPDSQAARSHMLRRG